MSNATAAGPSRGLLEVLFGSSKPEEAEADGQGFNALMELVKTLNGKKDKDEQGADINRTLRGIVPFKGGVDNSIAGMDGFSAAPDAQGSRLAQAPAGEDMKEKQERLLRLAMLSGIPVVMAAQANPLMAAQMPGAPIPEIRPDKVNDILKQNALPPLNQEEMKLLQAVNGKLEQVNAGQLPIDGAKSADPKAANPLDRLSPSQERVDPWNLALANGAPKMNAATESPAAGPADPRLGAAMAQKGLDPKKVKSAEVSASSSPAPEKMVSTESYLKMQESMGKAPVKDAMGREQLPVAGTQTQPKAADALTNNAVTETGSKGLSLSARKKGGDIDLANEGPKQAKLDAAAGGAFGANLSQSLKTDAPAQQDVFLPGSDKPGELRSVLLGQVGAGVAMHAHQGGGEMKLVIHPDEMGEVKLKIGTKNGKVEVQVMAENEGIAKIIRGGTQELTNSLREQNLTLSKLEVTVSSSSMMASSDGRSSLSEQFLSQSSQQQTGGFSQGNGAEDGRSARWAGSDQGSGKQGGAGYGSRAEDLERTAPRSAHSVPKQSQRYNSSGRLDVVA